MLESSHQPQRAMMTSIFGDHVIFLLHETTVDVVTCVCIALILSVVLVRILLSILRVRLHRGGQRISAKVERVENESRGYGMKIYYCFTTATGKRIKGSDRVHKGFHAISRGDSVDVFYLGRLPRVNRLAMTFSQRWSHEQIAGKKQAAAITQFEYEHRRRQ